MRLNLLLPVLEPGVLEKPERCPHGEAYSCCQRQYNYRRLLFRKPPCFRSGWSTATPFHIVHRPSSIVHRLLSMVYHPSSIVR